MSKRLGAGFVCRSSKLIGCQGHFAFFLTQPLLKLGLGLFLGEGSFFDAVQQVVVVHHTFVLQDGAGSVGHFCTNLQPIEGAIVHDVNRGGVGVGVIGTDFLDKTTVALCAGVGSYKMEEGLPFLTVTLEAEACCHLKNVLEGSETPLLILVKMGREDRQ